MQTAQEKPENQSLTEIAYESIKERIQNLTYAPGEAVTEAMLAEEFGMSKMPIRMAVRRLENEGLLVADFRRKIRVRKLTKKDVEEIYQLRRLFETAALKMIFDTGRTLEYSYRIEEKAVRIRAAAALGDLYEWEKADAAFHLEIISIFDNERIDKIYQNNHDEVLRIGQLSGRHKPQFDRVNEGLRDFVTALRNEDMDGALKILTEQHLMAGAEVAQELED